MSQEAIVDEVEQPVGSDANRFDDLQRAIEHAAHLLPAQGPITAFVHHNTLHAFEDLPFEEAVVKGAETFGCHPYLPEERYRQKLARGRILPEDIEAVLIDDLGDRGDELLGFLGTRFHLWQAILAHRLRTGPTTELRWVVAETDALSRFREETPRATRGSLIADTRHWIMRDLRDGSMHSAGNERLRAILDCVFERFDQHHIEQWDDATWEGFTLHLLWLVSKDGVRQGNVATANPPQPLRHRDLLLEATGEDSDRLVHDVLIRFCAAFLDQGFADWKLPNLGDGFYQSFLTLYGQPFGPAERWMRGLRKELRRVQDAKLSPLASIAESLDLLGVPADQCEEYVCETLLALRGFAGMIWQVETRGDRAARPLAGRSLIEFLAIRLILDRLALDFLAKEALAYRGPLSELREFLSGKVEGFAPLSIDQRAFLVFQLAQLLGWQPQALHRLSVDEWTLLLNELEAFNSLHRRRIYHLAFERRYRIQTLDAVATHSRCSLREQNTNQTAVITERSPTFQIICCIDEREESFRRHLEEVAPDCETLGAAGFFAVAMYCRGAADAHFTPLCPVIIKPRHARRRLRLVSINSARHENPVSASDGKSSAIVRRLRANTRSHAVAA